MLSKLLHRSHAIKIILAWALLALLTPQVTHAATFTRTSNDTSTFAPTAGLGNTETNTPTDASTSTAVITITNPADGSAVAPGSTVTIKTTVASNVARVDFYQGRHFRCSDSTPPFKCRWQVPDTVGRRHAITANAFDANSNFLGAAYVIVTAQ
jgi:hypothetical protein